VTWVGWTKNVGQNHQHVSQTQGYDWGLAYRREDCMTFWDDGRWRRGKASLYAVGVWRGEIKVPAWRTSGGKEEMTSRIGGASAGCKSGLKRWHRRRQGDRSGR